MAVAIAKFVISQAENFEISLEEVYYFLGYLVGFVIETIISILFTGGTLTLNKVLAETFVKPFTSLIKGFKSTLDALDNIFDKIINFIQTIFQKLKNLDQLLDDFLKWLTSIGLNAKAATILEQGASLNMDVLFGLFTTIKQITKKRWIKQLKKTGFAYKYNGDIITFVHKEQEVFSGPIKEAEEELAGYFKRAKKEGKTLEKYLDEVAELERRSFNKWDNGVLLSQRTLKKRIKNILFEYKNFKLDIRFVDDINYKVKLTDWNARNVLGSFDKGPPPKIFLRKQVTELTLQHELWHMEDLKKLGKQKFYNTPNWKHEESVWNKIWKNKHKWTEEELADSYKYYKEVAKKGTGNYSKIQEMEILLEKPYYKYVRYKK